MNKKTNEYAELSAAEKATYDGYKDHIEPVDVQLPSTKLGSEARVKALKESRVMTNKQARYAGKADLLPGEAKSKAHLTAELAKLP